jgi:calcineurin-like phosphoesterase family protein
MARKSCLAITLGQLNDFTKKASRATHERVHEVFKKEKCDIAIHGHLHTKDTFTDKSREINVSIERTKFQPVRLGELIR